MVSLYEHKCQGRSVELHDRVADDDGPLLQPATGRNYSMSYLHDELCEVLATTNKSVSLKENNKTTLPI